MQNGDAPYWRGGGLGETAHAQTLGGALELSSSLVLWLELGTLGDLMGDSGTAGL